VLISLQEASLVEKRMAARRMPAEDLVAPFLLGPFRLLDRLFTGGRVTASFQLDKAGATPLTSPPAPPRRPATSR
jgi:hypothetical protein